MIRERPLRQHVLRILMASLGAQTLCGCGFSVHVPASQPPAAYVSPPPPGQRRCIEIGEDIFGRKYCARYAEG